VRPVAPVPTMPGASLRPIAPLPAGIRSRFVDGVNGLRMHVLEAGASGRKRPLLLLLHGFPELAYSWRKVMGPLADAGFHVVAPDQRGYGLTSGWDADYDGDVGSFRMWNIVRDAIGLVHALGRRQVTAVIGHDFGSLAAAWCALIRPDVFPALAMMSAPFPGPPELPFDLAEGDDRRSQGAGLFGAIPHEALASLPRPRKHYQAYYARRAAATDLRDCPQGVHAFLRAYFHMKSADWPHNRPVPLRDWSAEEFARLPEYYVMDLDKNMAETVAAHMPSEAEIAACRWLPDAELAVYSEAFRRTGFQGGLNWYRCALEPRYAAELEVFSGRTIDVPSVFIAGAADWGPLQKPGDLDRMRSSACTRMLGCHFVPGAGHWVQQEQPEATVRLLLDFLNRAD